MQVYHRCCSQSYYWSNLFSTALLLSQQTAASISSIVIFANYRCSHGTLFNALIHVVESIDQFDQFGIDASSDAILRAVNACTLYLILMNFIVSVTGGILYQTFPFKVQYCSSRTCNVPMRTNLRNYGKLITSTNFFKRTPTKDGSTADMQLTLR
jgi:hypothetical protein